ncbi:hypothetical protein GCM10009422_29040 [Brevundimonas kwangchunensis]|uniref:Uncharacterized protein n=1 Tax=Brevundimonas kwangchunensis TaxID=322163 RepID=A0ABP3SD55_9CAUL
MYSKSKPLPQWTWEDLEAVLNGFDPEGEDAPVRQYLMRGLVEEAEGASPRELLQQVLSAGWVMAQVGARTGGSATGRLHEAGASVS